MEKEILEILKSIQLDIKGLKDEVKDLKEGQKIRRQIPSALRLPMQR